MINAIDEQRLIKLSNGVAENLLHSQLRLATAESCTGGWVAKVLTDIAGSSRWFERGFVTYTNEAKHEMLGVDNQVLKEYGAVSQQSAVAMAEGAINNSHASISLSITGIAGPGGGTTNKPVGLVWFAWGFKDSQGQLHVSFDHKMFSGNRESIRQHAVCDALDGLNYFINHVT